MRPEAAGAPPWPLLPALALCGAGQGLFAVPFFTMALHGVRPSGTGSAAGLLNAVQQVGGTLGVAVLGTLFLGADTARQGATHAWAGAAGLTAAACVAATLMTPGRAPDDPTGSASGSAGSAGPTGSLSGSAGTAQRPDRKSRTSR